MPPRAPKNLVINVDRIPAMGGVTLDETLPLLLFTETLKDSKLFSASGPAQLHATLTKISGGVLLSAKFEFEVQAPCKRCLLDTVLKLPVSLTLNLIPESMVKGDRDVAGEGDDDGKAERGGTFRLDDAETETFDGKQIDLDPIVREQVLLALPMETLCKEDCKGLCVQCGQNLNEAKCGCDPKPLDPRLAALKNIKLKPQA